MNNLNIVNIFKKTIDAEMKTFNNEYSKVKYNNVCCLYEKELQSCKTHNNQNDCRHISYLLNDCKQTISKLPVEQSCSNISQQITKASK